jgi:hypothetical protein
MSDERDTELIVEVPVVILAEAHDVGLFPRGKDLVDDAGVSLLRLTGGGICECKRRRLQNESCA